MDSYNKKTLSKEESKKILEKMFPKAIKTEIFYFDENKKISDEKHAKTYITKMYDEFGNMINESFGYIDNISENK